MKPIQILQQLLTELDGVEFTAIPPDPEASGQVDHQPEISRQKVILLDDIEQYSLSQDGRWRTLEPVVRGLLNHRLQLKMRSGFDPVSKQRILDCLDRALQQLENVLGELAEHTIAPGSDDQVA